MSSAGCKLFLQSREELYVEVTRMDVDVVAHREPRSSVVDERFHHTRAARDTSDLEWHISLCSPLESRPIRKQSEMTDIVTAVIVALTYQASKG